MNEKKSFLSVTKWLWIGFIMGSVLQLLGELDKVLFGYIGAGVFNFSDIMGALGFWAAAILLLIFRQKPPKTVLRDIFFLFAAMDFGYYLVQFIFDLMNVRAARSKGFGSGVGEIFRDALIDFAFYTAIGTAAAVWGCFAVKWRNSGKKRLYTLMLFPLFAVMLLEMTEELISAVMYFIEQSNMKKGIMPPDGTRRALQLTASLTDFIALIICGIRAKIFHRKK